MRCDCCDKVLSSYESTLKHGHTGEYLDTCLKCLNGLGIPIEGNSEEEAYSHDDNDEALETDEIYNESCIRYDTDDEEET